MKTEKMAEAPSVLDPLLAAIARDCGCDPDKLRKRLLDDAPLRSMFLTPLVKMWCAETIYELKKGNENA